MEFTYAPETTGIHISSWVFRIRSMGIESQFYLVGEVVEPKVMFDVPRLNFNPLLLNAKSVEKIKLLNKDHIPVAFNFSHESVKGEPR